MNRVIRVVKTLPVNRVIGVVKTLPVNRVIGVVKTLPVNRVIGVVLFCVYVWLCVIIRPAWCSYFALCVDVVGQCFRVDEVPLCVLVLISAGVRFVLRVYKDYFCCLFLSFSLSHFFSLALYLSHCLFCTVLFSLSLSVASSLFFILSLSVSPY